MDKKILDTLFSEMVGFYTSDPKRIQHFTKVYTYAALIGRGEGLDEHTQFVLESAAIVHDIGIRPAEEMYGKGICGGDLQQKLGPAPAREMLKRLGYSDSDNERICFLIAHHHTYSGVKGLDWQILLEADFLVNAFEDDMKRETIINFRNRVFKTNIGTELLNTMFGI